MLLLQRGAMTVCCFLASALGAQALAQSGGAVATVKVDGRDAGAASSAGVLADGTLYLAAQDGRSADGSVPKDFAQEVGQSLRSMQGVLRATGMDFGNLVWVNVYVTHATDVAAMNDVYWKTIGMSPPARTVLVVGALPHGANVAINGIAVKDTASRREVWPVGWRHGPGVDPPAIAAKDVFYLSAQSGADPVTGKLAADYAGEVKQALDNVATVLKAANMTMANIVFVNPFLTADSSQGR